MIFDMRPDTPVLVQGITGHQGRAHSSEMLKFGTNIVGGVVPGKGRETVNGIPVFDTVDEAISTCGAEISVMFVPSGHCLEAAMEAMDAGIRMLVIITEHVAIKDSLIMKDCSKKIGCTIIGPNSPGLGVPGTIKLGIMPNQIFSQGNVGIISRSGTLTYEIVQGMTDLGIGQRCCLGVGGDPIHGLTMMEAAEEYCEIEDMSAVLLIGEIGGEAEVRAARILRQEFDGPVITYLAGRNAPAGKKMGHAGAIISDGSTSIDEKTNRLADIGVDVVKGIGDVPLALKTALQSFRG